MAAADDRREELRPPAIHAGGRRWSSEEIAGTALRWRGALGPPPDGPVAMVMGNDPRSVTLFFALSTLPVPVVLLPPDARAWRTSPALPAGTRLVLLEEQRGRADAARSLGLDVAPLEERAARAPSGDARFMATPGFVLFTSGSTGMPRPVYRGARGLVAVSRALVAAAGLRPGAGVIASLPLGRAFGLNHGLVAAAVLGAPLALLDRFEHSALLRLFATGEYEYWAGTPMMADVLGRCALTSPHPAPRVCLMGGRVPVAVAARFRERFGVALGLIYGTTETGSIGVDVGRGDAERADTVVTLIDGVAARIGADPRMPVPAGVEGRIWLSAPAYMMDGYGYPPALEAPETVDGWWGTPDVGSLAADGRLTVCGRLDDTWRTSTGQMVNPAPVMELLERHPDVVDAAVVPLAAATGPVLGVLVETAASLRAAELRAHLSRSLPGWLQPRVVELTAALPRLPNGRIDRTACIARLERELGRSAADA